MALTSNKPSQTLSQTLADQLKEIYSGQTSMWQAHPDRIQKMSQYAAEETIETEINDPYLILYYNGSMYKRGTAASSEHALQRITELQKQRNVTDIQLFERVDRWSRDWAKR